MISDLYDSLVKAFRAYKCPAPIYLGEHFRSQHTVPLRVVLWQGKDSPADAFSGAVVAGLTPTQAIQYINPRPVATRECGFSAELWATAPTQRNVENQYRANLAYLDALINQLVTALQQISSGVYRIQGGRAAAGNADATVSGLGYTLACVCDIPIIDARWPEKQLSECSKSWAYGPASADISIENQNDPPTVSPRFTVPTPEE